MQNKESIEFDHGLWSWRSYRIFSDEFEKDLAQHAVNLSARFFGLSCVQTRKLAYNFATLNDVAIPASWLRDKAAGLDWLQLFMGQNKLSVRKPEATSLGRATAFNRHNLDDRPISIQLDCSLFVLIGYWCMFVLYFSKSISLMNAECLRLLVKSSM